MIQFLIFGSLDVRFGQGVRSIVSTCRSSIVDRGRWFDRSHAPALILIHIFI
jgi:hypothetical protein